MFFLFSRFNKFRPILYRFITQYNVYIPSCNERKKFVCECVCIEGDGALTNFQLVFKSFKKFFFRFNKFGLIYIGLLA